MDHFWKLGQKQIKCKFVECKIVKNCRLILQLMYSNAGDDSTSRKKLWNIYSNSQKRFFLLIIRKFIIPNVFEKIVDIILEHYVYQQLI